MLDLNEEWDVCERCGDPTLVLEICPGCQRFLCGACLPVEQEFCDECRTLDLEGEEGGSD